MKTLAVIIVNWNGKEFLKECLESLRMQTLRGFRVICVDNGSTDGSRELLHEFSHVECIELSENNGFAEPNNIGIARAFEDPNISFIVTLNNDAKVDPAYLQELVSCAERHPDAGSIQPKVLRMPNQDILDSTGMLIYKDMSAINRGQGDRDVGQYSEEEEVFGASASAALYARRALEDVAFQKNEYFDRDYFAYYEDVDLAWRLRLRGFRSFYAPRALVYHVHSATGKRHSPFKSFHIHRNQYYTMFKNLPTGALLRALAFMPIRYLLLLSSVMRKKGPAAKLSESARGRGMLAIVLRSWMHIMKALPRLLAKRKMIQGKRVVGGKEIERWFAIYKASLSKMLYDAS